MTVAPRPFAPCSHAGGCVFGGLDADLHRRAHGLRRVRAFHAGQVLYREGDEASAFFIVSAGRVKSTRSLPSGREQLTGLASAPRMFGLPAVLANGHHQETVTALTDGAACCFERNAALPFITQEHAVTCAFVHSITESSSHAEAQWRTLANMELEERVLWILTLLAWPEPGGPAQPVELRRQDLADLAGATKEATIRALSGLLRTGRVVREGKALLPIVCAA